MDFSIFTMKRLYIDIDGVLLTTKKTQTPCHAIEFIDYIITEFDCYWLTSHCRSGKKEIESLLLYLSSYYNTKTIEKLKTIKPTSWETAKTEGIDLTSDFYWLDDYPFEFEKAILKKHCKLDRLIVVDLNKPDELKRIKALLQSINTVSKKYLFLDIDGVLNSG